MTYKSKFSVKETSQVNTGLETWVNSVTNHPNERWLSEM